MTQDASAGADARATLAARCLSIDLEVSRESGRLFAFAAVRGDTEQSLVFRGQWHLPEALDKLDAFSEGCDFVLGHNAIAFDIPILAAARPSLALLRVPVLDTLRLNPLAFPRNPYHRLVKHYRDGGFNRWRRNDPELDARLALELLKQQQRAFASLQASAPALPEIWHGLLGAGDVAVDSLFTELRDAPRPMEQALASTLATFLAGRACSVRASSRP